MRPPEPGSPPRSDRSDSPEPSLNQRSVQVSHHVSHRNPPSPHSSHRVPQLTPPVAMGRAAAAGSHQCPTEAGVFVPMLPPPSATGPASPSSLTESSARPERMRPASLIGQGNLFQRVPIALRRDLPPFRTAADRTLQTPRGSSVHPADTTLRRHDTIATGDGPPLPTLPGARARAPCRRNARCHQTNSRP